MRVLEEALIVSGAVFWITVIGFILGNIIDSILSFISRKELMYEMVKPDMFDPRPYIEVHCIDCNNYDPDTHKCCKFDLKIRKGNNE